MSGQPAPIRPRERFLARVIVVVFAAGVLSAVLPVVADPARSAMEAVLSEFDAEEASDSGEAGAGPRVVVPDTATPTAPPTTAPPEVETVIVEEAPPTTTTTTTTVPPTTTTTAVPGSIPPAAGTYPYVLRYSDDEGVSAEATGRLVVQAAREADGENRQTHVYTDQVYGTQSQALAWRGDGVFLRLIDDGSGAEGNSCDYEPDVLLYPLPTTVGHAWETDTACADDPDGRRLMMSSTVERADRITVGGEKVDVFVITTTEEGTEEEGSYAVTQTTYFAPSVGLDVKTEADFRFDEDDGSTSEWNEEYELKTLKPQ